MTKIAIIFLTLFSLSTRLSAQDLVTGKYSGITPSEALGICGYWNVQDWQAIEADLALWNYNIIDAYFDIKCTWAHDPNTSQPLFTRAYMDSSYKVTYKRLMRMFTRQNTAIAKERLTCALEHHKYKGATVYQHIDDIIRSFTAQIQHEDDEERIVILERAIKNLEAVKAYMKRHTDKYPVTDPDKNCPK